MNSDVRPMDKVTFFIKGRKVAGIVVSNLNGRAAIVRDDATDILYYVDVRALTVILCGS